MLWVTEIDLAVCNLAAPQHPKLVSLSKLVKLVSFRTPQKICQIDQSELYANMVGTLEYDVLGRLHLGSTRSQGTAVCIDTVNTVAPPTPERGR